MNKSLIFYSLILGICLASCQKNNQWSARSFKGAGNASAAGKCSIDLQYCSRVFNYNKGSVNGEMQGSAIITAENGDYICCDLKGTCRFGDWDDSGPRTTTLSASGIVTGGTGKFRGATGTFIGGGTTDMAISPSPAQFFWQGEIRY